MTLAVHRLAGAAAAIAIGGALIFGSIFLAAKSHIPPVATAKPAPSSGVAYFQTYKSQPIPITNKDGPAKKSK